MEPETHFVRVTEARLNLIVALVQADNPLAPAFTNECQRLSRVHAATWSAASSSWLGSEMAIMVNSRRVSAATSTGYSRFFERDILQAMDKFQAEIKTARHTVRQRAFEKLEEPANWPFDPDLSPQAGKPPEIR